MAGLEEDYMFPVPGEIEGLVLANGSSASISLPRELLSSRGSGGSLSMHLCLPLESVYALAL